MRRQAERPEHRAGGVPAAQHIRFVLDFAYATGLRSSELVAARIGDITVDESGNRWIRVVGKGSKSGRVAIPPQAHLAPDRYLAARGLSTDPTRWVAATPLIAILVEDCAGLTGSRLWTLMKRLFAQLAQQLEPVNPAVAEKLKRASSHWMRHTHATHALGRGVTLTTVRENLRHASVSTSSTYLHSDEQRRAHEIAAAFDDNRSAERRLTATPK